jgi:hypothetical protein
VGKCNISTLGNIFTKKDKEGLLSQDGFRKCLRAEIMALRPWSTGMAVGGRMVQTALQVSHQAVTADSPA